MKRITFLLTLLLLFACTPEKVPAGGSGDGQGTQTGEPQPTPAGNLTGTVTDSKTGAPIAGVSVSDGYSWAVTDDEGVYFLQGTSQSRTVYLSVPSEYEIPVDENHQPAFYVNGDFSDADKTYKNDFQLTPRSVSSDRFILAGIADVHIYEERDLQIFKEETLPDVKGALESLSSNGDYKECIAVFAGDQMSDNMQMVESFKQSLAGHNVAGRRLLFLHCIGNHDFANSDLKDIEPTSYNASKTYVRNFGPMDYSFNIGKVHFIVMNNIVVNSKDNWTRDHQIQCVGYSAGFTDAQMEWLEADLALVKNPQEKAVVLVSHIPLKNGKSTNYQAVTQLLAGFNEAHVISGHTHRLDNFIHDRVCKGGKKLYEHNLQMASGMWWKSRLSTDGSPTGYGLFRFSGSRMFDSYNKGTGLDIGCQLRVYSGNDVYNGKTQGGGVSAPKHNQDRAWADDLKGKFIARVWDADTDNWEVEFVKDGVSTPMTRVASMSDECTYSFSHNILDTPFGSESTYQPKSANFWTIDAPSGDPAKETGWKVVAKRKFSAAWVKTYEADELQRDYTGFALDR